MGKGTMIVVRDIFKDIEELEEGIDEENDEESAEDIDEYDWEWLDNIIKQRSKVKTIKRLVKSWLLRW